MDTVLALKMLYRGKFEAADVGKAEDIGTLSAYMRAVDSAWYPQLIVADWVFSGG